MRDQTVWKFCCGAVILLVVLTFTPFVTPTGTSGPFFLGMPYTLWMGLLVSVLLLVLTIIGSRVHPGNKDSE